METGECFFPFNHIKLQVVIIGRPLIGIICNSLVCNSFLIPIIMDIQYIASGTSNPKESAILIAERLVASGAVVISAQVLSQVIKKIIEKIK